MRVIITQYAHTVISCCIISYVILLIIGILYSLITIYLVFSLLHPFAKTRNRLRRPRPYHLIYLPTYPPTNQPTNLPTYLLTQSTLHMPA